MGLPAEIINNYVYNSLKVVKEIKQYQKKWLQHVQRMDRNRLPRQALECRPDGRRNIGRLKKRWRDQLHFEDSGTGTQLTLNEHNDVDDDEVSDTKHKCCQFTWSLKYIKFQITD